MSGYCVYQDLALVLAKSVLKLNAFQTYLCGFLCGAAGCWMASFQRLRVRPIALVCSHLSLSARHSFVSRVKYERRVDMG